MYYIMSICIEAIIKHDLYDLKDINKVRELAQRFCDEYERHFHTKLYFEEYFETEEGTGELWIDIDIPIGIAHLYAGHWEIYISERYVNMIRTDYDFYIDIRNWVFDLTLVLGATEAWYCNDYDISTSDCDDFEKLMGAMCKLSGGPLEYSKQIVIDNEQKWFYLEPRLFFHDSFAECSERFRQLSERVSKCGVRLLGLSRYGAKFLLVEHGAGVNLIDMETMKLFFEEPADEIVLFGLSDSFGVCRNGLWALFDGEKQSTPYKYKSWEKASRGESD